MILSVAWSPDGTLLASIADNGTIRVADPDQNALTFQFALTVSIPSAAVAWSSNGDSMAAGVGNQVYIWNTNTWQLTHQFTAGDLDGFFTPDGALVEIPEGMRSITWSDDSRYVITGSLSYLTTVWDNEESRVSYQAYDGSGGGPGRIWLGDGWLGDGATKLNVFSGELILLAPDEIQNTFGIGGGPNATEARPNFSQIAWGTEFGYLLVFDLNTLYGVHGLEVTESVPPTPRRALTGISWNHSGEFITAVSRDGELYVVNLLTEEVASVLTIDGQLHAVDWNPQTNQVTYGGVSSAGEPVLETVDVSGIAGVPDDTPTTADTPVASQSPKHFQRMRMATHA